MFYSFFAVETTLACVCRLLAENPMAQKHVKEEVKELFDFVEKVTNFLIKTYPNKL